MQAKGVFLVPTLGVLADRGNTPEERQRSESRFKRALDKIQMAMSLGLKIASGSDASQADLHGKNARELASLVKCGMRTADAIRAGTVNAAELMGWQASVGAIEVGKYADLITVEGDPLADITVLQHVRFVMKGGHVAKAW